MLLLFNNHQVVAEVVQGFAAVFGYDYEVFDAHAELAGQVNAGFNGEAHAGLCDDLAGGGVIRMFVHFDADAVAGAMDEIGAVAAVFDYLAGGAVKFAHGHAGANGLAAGFVGSLYQLIHLFLFFGYGFIENGAGHIAGIAVVGEADVDNHAVAGLEGGFIVVVVGLGAVGAKAGDGGKAGGIAAGCLGILFVGFIPLFAALTY